MVRIRVKGKPYTNEAGEKRKLVKTLERRYKFEGTEGWKKDNSIPLWSGQTIKDVIPSMYSGTNFRLKSYKTKKINPKRTIVYQILQKRCKYHD